MESKEAKNGNEINKKRNRKRPYGESTKIAYGSTTFQARESSGRPRSPHRFFRSSHTVAISDIHFHRETKETDTEIAVAEKRSFQLNQVVHHHVNGLCIVTAGESLPSDIQSIKFIAKEAPAFSNAEKRKRQAKMLKGGKVENSVTPSTEIAQLKLKAGETIPLYACVWGTILELNTSLTPEILLDDPLLDGYLAVILPSGTFPPKIVGTASKDSEHSHANKKVKKSFSNVDDEDP